MKTIITNQQPYRKDWMSDDQYECCKLLADVVGGFHHIYTPIRESGSDGIETNICGSWASYDFDQLTKIIIMGFDRMIRIEISSCNMRYFKLRLHKRHKREGLIMEKIPRIEEYIEKIRAEFL